MAKPTIYISYRRADGPDRARFIHDILSSMGIDADFDPDHAETDGALLPAEVTKEITDRGCLLAFLNPKTLTSDWVRQEIDMAHKLNKRILLLTTSDFRPKEHIPPEMAYLHDHRTIKYDHVDPVKSFNRIQRIVFRPEGSMQTQAMRAITQHAWAWVVGGVALVIVIVLVLTVAGS